MKAGDALRVSQRTYDLETEPVLGLTRCSNDEHRLPRKSIFVLGERIFENVPDDHKETDFVGLDYDFENLGRTALLDIVVGIRLGDTQTRYISIGNIGAEKEAHVSVNLLWNAVTWPTIGWETPARVRGDALEYLPPQLITVRAAIRRDARIPRRWAIQIVEPLEAAKPDVATLPEQAKGSENLDKSEG